MGEVAEVRLGFACDGVLHEWYGCAAWFSALEMGNEIAELTRSLELEDRTSRQEAEWEELETSVDPWARQLAGNRRFYQARNDGERRFAAALLIPRVGELVRCDRRSGDGQRLNSIGLEVLRRATALVRSEILPQLEADALQRLGDLTARMQTYPRLAEATTKQRLRLIRDFLLDEVGLTTPELAEALERRLHQHP